MICLRMLIVMLMMLLFQLKRKQVQLQSKYEGVAPKLVLLTLLAECCIVTLTQTQVNYKILNSFVPSLIVCSEI